MNLSSFRVFAFALVILLCRFDHGLAQEAGDRVIAKAKVSLRSGRTVVATVAPDTLLVVEKTNGNWLLVHSPETQKGWVLKTEVRPAPAAAPPVGAEPVRATEPAYDQLADADLVPGELVVTLHADADRADLDQALKSLRHEAKILETIPAANTYLVSVPNDALHECRLRLGIHPYVEGCGLNTVHTLTRTYDDPALAEGNELGWNLHRIKVFDAWDTTTGGAKIAIVDSGIKADHAEFLGKLNE